MNTTRKSWASLLEDVEAMFEAKELERLYRTHDFEKPSKVRSAAPTSKQLAPLEQLLMPINERVRALYEHASGQREHAFFEEDLAQMREHFARTFSLLHYREAGRARPASRERDEVVGLLRALVYLNTASRPLAFSSLPPLAQGTNEALYQAAYLRRWFQVQIVVTLMIAVWALSPFVLFFLIEQLEPYFPILRHMMIVIWIGPVFLGLVLWLGLSEYVQSRVARLAQNPVLYHEVMLHLLYKGESLPILTAEHV